MRAYDIALFLLVFNIVLATTNELEIFDNSKFSHKTLQADNDYIQNVNASADEATGFSIYGLQEIWQYLANVLSPVAQVISIVGKSTVMVNYLIADILGNTTEAQQIGNLLAIPIYIVYLAGLWQFIRGTGFRGMD